MARGWGDEDDLLDEVRIRRLQSAYVDAVNRRAWPEFIDLFRPDSVLEVSAGGERADEVVGPEAIGSLIGGYLEPLDFLVQVVLNARIVTRWRGDADRAAARLSIAEHRQATATGRERHSFGTYHDEYVRVDGRWWFARRRYDRQVVTAEPGSARDLDVLPMPASATDLGMPGDAWHIEH